MANNIYNTMSINKDDAERYVLNGNNKVDFNILIPMSNDLSLPSGSITDIANEVYEYRETGNDSKLKERIARCKKYNVDYPEDVEEAIAFEEKKYEYHKDKTNIMYCENYVDLYTLGKQYKENLEKYGSINWYDWSHKNWGCKWNARDTKIEDLSNDLYKIEFTTPWSPPELWLTELSSKCPFYNEWIEESGCHGYHGEIYSSNKDDIVIRDLDNTEFDDRGQYREADNPPTFTFDTMCNEVSVWKMNWDKLITEDNENKSININEEYWNRLKE